MVKGCQRKIIHVKDPGSKYYEEAYFILKPGAGESGGANADMIDEALKIAGESLCSVAKKNKPKIFQVGTASFLIGAAAGSALCVLIFMLI